jgi:uncharacterized protein (DUF1330 family)
MSAYCIFDFIEISDYKKMDTYRKQVGPTVKKYKGHYRAVGSEFKVMEGEWNPVFPVIIEFPTLAQAYKWYDSREYRKLKDLRTKASKSNVVIIDGNRKKRSSNNS